MNLTPPETVKIGSFSYAVKVKKKLSALGRTRHRFGLIYLAGDQHVDQARDTLLHELIHAAIWVGGSMRMLGATDSDIADELEENICRLLAPQLLGIIRDNPDLLAFLRGDESETAT